MEEPTEAKVGEAVIKLLSPVWCRPKALRCLCQLWVVKVAEEVKMGALHKVSMWDFVQVTVVVTRVLEIRFSNWELRQVSGTSEGCFPSTRKKACLPLVLVALMLDMLD
ncbi:unnamed protein product [Prunus armeniaca]